MYTKEIAMVRLNSGLEADGIEIERALKMNESEGPNND
jgi:hypothetical protein